jgi:hypothetical protein
MTEKDISEVLNEKGKDIKRIFKEMEASLENWKFSVEETSEGIMVEVHAKALVKKKE